MCCAVAVAACKMCGVPSLEADLSDVEPTAHPLDLVNVWSDDEPRPSLTVEEALANAPDRDGALFRVPAG